jgi:ketosteroid isomerase-like protein
VSQENTDVVRRIYEDWGQGRFDAGSELFDPWVVLVLRGDFPDAGAYLGPAEIRKYMRSFLRDWDHAAIEGREFIAAGDSVVVGVHQHAAGKGSGAPVSMDYFQIWTFRGGSVIRIESVRERRQALEATGFAE